MMVIFLTVNLLNIHHGYNFRDLGGYHTQDGKTLRAHKLVRAGKLSDLSDRDLSYLADYGVRDDVDFRSPDEKKMAPDRVPEGTVYHFDPVFPHDETKVSKSWAEEQQAFSLDALGGHHNMIRTYGDMIVNPTSQKAYRAFFDVLLANENSGQSVLFHCSAGKDRTGMAAVFLLSALGVDEATIRTDYLTTNDYVGGALQAVLDKAKAGGANANMLQGLTDLWVAKPEYLDTALATIDKNYGSMAQYLHQALQLTGGELKDLRQFYLI
ncbi:tyrosine-protein phosphatase [Lacticaseibacillus mingshuiensis]|uniref:Tyrosine-protein phosphatase n=1 Tax=Lacticaseibacillus mingshuiensis TaxID=2799574 RepID=A0ABW4CL09_9LACO